MPQTLEPQTRGVHTRLGQAWVVLCLALVLQVLDETATGFLSVYNPTVMALREKVPWLPVPTFRFEIWLGGLLAGCALLLALSPFAYAGARWIRPIAYAFAVLMIFNAMGHTAGTIAGRTFASVPVPRPMPGFYSSPFLLAGSLYFVVPPAHAAPWCAIIESTGS